MVSVPFTMPRATSGTTISESGSAGVPGMCPTRGSSCAWFASTGSRCSIAQPVRPSPGGDGVSIASRAQVPRARSGRSSRRTSSHA